MEPEVIWNMGEGYESTKGDDHEVATSYQAWEAHISNLLHEYESDLGIPHHCKDSLDSERCL